MIQSRGTFNLGRLSRFHQIDFTSDVIISRQAGFSTLCGSILIGTRLGEPRMGVFTSFSTLCGSILIGTRHKPAYTRLIRTFQYPLRVDLDWNYGVYKTLAFPTSEFQYPLRVDLDWNVRRTSKARRRAAFQYPLRVDLDWNSWHVWPIAITR